MTNRAAQHIATLILDLKARAAVASGDERAKLLSAVRYYEQRQPRR